MQITDVRVFPVRDDKLKAFVSVVFESCFMVNDIKVINGRDGYFISMPSRRKKNGEFKDIAHPLNTDTRRMLEERILDEYEQVVALDEPPVRRYQKEQESSENEQKGSEARTETPSPGAPAAKVPAPSARLAGPDDDAPGGSDSTDEKPRAEAADEQPPAEHQVAESADDESASESDSEDKNRKDMDEVVETHLSDAFWS